MSAERRYSSVVRRYISPNITLWLHDASSGATRASISAMTASTQALSPDTQTLLLLGSYPVVKLGRSCDHGMNNGVSALAGEALRAVLTTSAPTTTASDLTLKRLTETCMCPLALRPVRLPSRTVTTARRSVNGPEGWLCAARTD